MKRFTEKLFTELTEELLVYAALGTLPVRKVTGAIHSIQSAFEKLKRHIADTPFKYVYPQGPPVQFINYNCYLIQLITHV